MSATVVLTDYAWPDASIERSVIEGAGHRLVAGPSAPAPANVIEGLVAENNPAAILTNWATVSAKAIKSPSALQIVARLGVGLDNIDVEAATGRGAWVTNVPDYCVEEVSDHAVAMLLAWARGIVDFDRSVKAGVWNPAGSQLRRVRDLTVGVVGFGLTGRATLSKLAALNVERLATCPRPPAESMEGVQFVGFDELLGRSDVVILHAPLNASTRSLFGEAAFARMKPGAFLVNVSRGEIVDNLALIKALDSGQLSGAALDVVAGEPQPPRELVGRADVIATPHVAFSSTASVADLRRRASEEVVRVLAGQAPRYPRNDPATV